VSKSSYAEVDVDVNRKIETLSRTQDAVRKQISAMAAAMFEVGVFDPESERMILRTWNEEAIIKSIPWLRFENLKGRNIYIRPAGAHSLSLLDDLRAESLLRMKTQGFQPALVVETSPGNFQVWLQHGRVLSKDISTATAKALARRFGGDQGSADWRHFGRLAGFTNRKEKHRRADGYSPYVRILEATATQYPEAARFLREMEAELKAAVEASAKRREFLRKRPQSAIETIKGIEYFRIHPKYGGAQSRSDLAYAVYALDHGVCESRVRDAIATQDLSFKGSSSRQADYIDRIIDKANAFLRGATMERQ
jgi:hypothetical protein